MMKKQDPFRNSELDRAKPSKSHFFRSLVSDRFKRHRSDTGLVEDRTSSVTIVRIIVGLLMIHLIIIGGVLLRGKMVRDGAGLATSTSISPPPTPPAPPVTAPAQDVLPQPVVPPVAAVRPAVSTGHITQAVQEEDVAEVVEDEPVIITPVSADPAVPVAPAAPVAAAPKPAAPVVHEPAPAEKVRHKVARGDTLYRIANQYNVTEAAIRAANPSLGQGVLRAGSTLEIPVGSSGASTQVIPAVQVPRVVTTPPPPARPAAPAAPRVSAPAQAAAPAAGASSYVVSSGDTLSSISRKVGVPVSELMRLNNIKQANRIRIGQKLRLR